MIKYYVSYRSHTVHMVSDFPAPKSEGYTQCGKVYIGDLFRTNDSILAIEGFRLCKSCDGLIDDD